MASVLGSFNLLRRVAASPTLAKFPLASLGHVSNKINMESRRGAKKWYPDKQFMEQFEGTLMYPEEARWQIPMAINRELHCTYTIY